MSLKSRDEYLRLGRATDRLTFVGITGTNGKTSTSYFLEQILRKAGKTTGVVGTIEYRIGTQRAPAGLTTPVRPRLRRILGEMTSEGVTHAIAEVSSHALAEGRVDGANFDLCIFTNLSQDHLRFHRTMEKYFAAKKRLFVELLAASRKPRLGAVINIDDPYGFALSKQIPPSIEKIEASVWGGQRSAGAVAKVRIDVSGFRGQIVIRDESFQVRSSLVGAYNVYNVLVAMAAARFLGVDREVLGAIIPELCPPPGRLEKMSTPWGATCFVDYAHTPSALAAALSACREIAQEKGGRLIAVIGCGGDRDSSKRPLMGRIATRLADLTYFTADNSRHEAPLAIIDSMQKGALRRKACVVQQVRHRAISSAISATTSQDVVIVAGRGHEYRQEVSGRIKFLDDRLLVQASVARESIWRAGQIARYRDVAVPTTTLRDISRVTGAELILRGSERRFNRITFDAASRSMSTLLVFQPLAALYKLAWPLDRMPSGRFIGMLIPRSLAYWYTEIQKSRLQRTLLIVEDPAVALEALSAWYGIKIGPATRPAKRLSVRVRRAGF